MGEELRMWNCTKCDMSMWGDEILENDWCIHHFPYRDTDDYKKQVARDNKLLVAEQES